MLRGRDAEDAGVVRSHRLDGRTAMALSRGLHPKAYAAVDPNEDVVALVADADRRLAVIADGHHGAEGAEAAVETVLSWCADAVPEPGVSLTSLVDLLQRVDEAVLATPRGARTTLTVAWGGSTSVQWVAFGDSPVLLVDGRDGQQLSLDRHLFLGSGWSAPELAARLTTGTAPLTPGAALVLVTDGYSGFAQPLGAPGAAASTMHAATDDAQVFATRLVEQACRDGAGDNVAAAVLLGAGSP